MKPDVAIEDVRLTQMTKTAGCAAKIGPGTLAEVIKNLPKFFDEKLLVGFETSDDAAVYKISDEIAVIQTLDFFTPVVDDPYTFGQIAAANALSDVYAMGGEPKLALNIVAYPNCLGIPVLSEILRGGADKVKEAGASLAGGHSIQDDEPKYGLSVMGIVHPDKILKNKGAKPGDVIIITKPLGSGLINTAVKAGMASGEAMEEVVSNMSALNKTAKEVLEKYPVHACTDVTGFGLAGHVIEMAKASGVTIEVYADKIPVMKDALQYASMGLVPEGAYRNRNYTEKEIDMSSIGENYKDLIFDPQTSGGLMVSIEEKHAGNILKDLEKRLHTKFAIIGRVKVKEAKYMLVR